MVFGGDEDKSASLAGDATPANTIRARFLNYCAPDAFRGSLMQMHRTGSRLFGILQAKKAPMNAYEQLHEWHLKEKGVIEGQQTAADAGSEYISRPQLLKEFTNRYGMGDMMPKERTVRLPSSREVVKIPVHDAKDCMELLLTDPRIKDEDYCFFDDDPLAPPKELDYVGDIITGSAFADTYKALVKRPREQLMGVIFYIDGAATGQFAHLPVTILKMSLTCFTREARKKPHCWANLGYVPQVKASEGRGKKILLKSKHIEGMALQDLKEGEGDAVDFDDLVEPDEEEGRPPPPKPQDFHTILDVILKSYRELEKTGFVWDMVYKGKRHSNIHYHLFCPMVKVDTEEGDMLCGKYLSRTRNVQQLCRYCEVPTNLADRWGKDWPLKTQDKIGGLVKKAKACKNKHHNPNLTKLKALSQHCLHNAWYKVRMNMGNNRGIHGATPSEMLHAILLGIFKYTRDIFFTMVGDSAKVAHEINALAKILGKLLSRQSCRTFGSTNFNKGIKEGKLMAKDYRGVLLNMAAVLNSTEGKKQLHKKMKFKDDSTKSDWSLLVETLLQWEAFLNEPEMKKKDVQRLKTKNKYIMYLIKKIAKRNQGMGLKVRGSRKWVAGRQLAALTICIVPVSCHQIMKYHAILHMSSDILLYGVPLEMDTGANESHHKVSKVAAKLTQRNEETFNIQTAQRLFEFHVMDLALLEIDKDLPRFGYYEGVVSEAPMVEDSSIGGQELDRGGAHVLPASSNTDQNPAISTGDCQIRLLNDEETGDRYFTLLSRSVHAESTEKAGLSRSLIDFLHDLQDKIRQHVPQHELKVFTRHKRGDIIFRGHPNYRGTGAWNDWAVVNWGRGYGKVPCHISCFVDLEGIHGLPRFNFGGISVGAQGGVFAVVESSNFEVADETKRASELFVPLLKEVGRLDDEILQRSFYLADTSAIVEPCCVIPDIGGPPNRYFMVHSRTKWPGMFRKWLHNFHEDMSDEEDSDEDKKKAAKEGQPRKKKSRN